MYKVGIFLAIYWIMFGKLRFIYFESTFYCTVMVLGFSQGNLVPQSDHARTFPSTAGKETSDVSSIHFELYSVVKENDTMPISS